jgi:ATP-dependent Clp protease protease subunit
MSKKKAIKVKAGGKKSSEEVVTLKDKGIYFCSSDFNEDMAKEICTWILEANLQPHNDFDHLTLILHSPGGCLTSAFCIIDAMAGSKIPVHTIGLGQICSAGFCTFIAGEKGHRVLTPNTTIMSHQYAWGTGGKHHDLVSVRKEQDLVMERMMNHYKRHTGLKKKQIKKHLLPATDCWMSAEEALDLGVCDEIEIL